ncbi:MAG: anaerobic sulfatase-maturation protein [Luteolibacter sp.]|jgi:uncharacterized protein
MKQNPTKRPPPRAPFHVMAKPAGPMCNLRCEYCFYLEKQGMFPKVNGWRMSDEVLESYIRQTIAAQSTPEVSFAWQGGEPTLMGIDFFRKILALQKRHAKGKRIHNALQTNGTLLDDEWCEFLAANQFLVGISIDGPAALHDRYRRDRHEGPTHARVMQGLACLIRNGVEFNTLTVVNRHNSREPMRVYRFLKEIGSRYMQFIPLVERAGSSQSCGFQNQLAPPPCHGGGADDAEITPWSVRATDYGNFLCTIFDEWVRGDVGRYYVQIFDVMLGLWAGQGSSLCVFSQRCGNAVALEHNGDIFSCDHFVYPKYRLGNLMEMPLRELVDSARQRAFGNAKADSLPAYCRNCEFASFCNGECPKHRFLTSPDGEPGLNYLCAGYKRFLGHIDPYMRIMANLLAKQRPPAEIMSMLVARTARI